MNKPKLNNATILVGRHCLDCGWPVINACCNDKFMEYEDAAEWDYWNYCANKSCKNHKGEGVFQDQPKWISNHKL